MLVMHCRLVRYDFPLRIVMVPAVAVWASEGARVPWDGRDVGLAVKAGDRTGLAEDGGHGRRRGCGKR